MTPKKRRVSQFITHERFSLKWVGEGKGGKATRNVVGPKVFDLGKGGNSKDSYIWKNSKNYGDQSVQRLGIFCTPCFRYVKIVAHNIHKTTNCAGHLPKKKRQIGSNKENARGPPLTHFPGRGRGKGKGRGAPGVLFIWTDKSYGENISKPLSILNDPHWKTTFRRQPETTNSGIVGRKSVN